ncbi:MAG TPA: hypothetical protein VE172_09455 [Stackebrandtia sp.]|jgi:hypothetical protein|uniref:hypothetical protein n=1 Tax=Stackebrandtia sp. TaxID=2023065 RepID=UPI002D6BE54E|nr:hypothetical protein [Stackebrandtia sp.]HZE39021.1 hypothetical protein [Stackebrandtia sp.]
MNDKMPKRDASTMVDVSTVYGVGMNMQNGLQDYDKQSQYCDTKLTNAGPKGGVVPLGRDPRYLGVQTAVSYHSTCMESAKKLAQDFRTGTDRLARITRKITLELNYTDEQGGANLDLKKLCDVTGLPEKVEDPDEYGGAAPHGPMRAV